MATSPEYLRLASSASRPLTDTVFDALAESLLVVDGRVKHLPVVLANAAARELFQGVAGDSLLDTSLYALLGADADVAMDAALASSAGGHRVARRSLRWRVARGETAMTTDLKMLPAEAGQRMVLLTLPRTAAESPVATPADHLSLDVVILDRQFIVTYANASAARTAGGVPGGILNSSGLSLGPTACIPYDALMQALSGTHFHDDALAVPTAGRETRWFEVDVQPLTDSTGVAGLVVLSMEVTERRRRIRTSESERHLLALTQNARDIITVAGRDGRLQYISGGIKNALGYTVEERKLNSIFDHMHPDDVGAVRAKYALMVDGLIPTFSHQFRIRHKDGSYRWLESSYVPALDNPLVNGVVINSRDITERRQAESQLAQREEVFQLATDAVNGIVFEWDLATGTAHRSRGVRDVLGLESEDLEATGAWTARVHPHDREAYAKTLEAALSVGRGYTTTYRMRDGRGRYRSMLERGLIQRNDAGAALRAIGCCVDVSEIQRLTDLLAEAQRAARMGGWEYSYSTGELTWTDEMFRIYEASPKDFHLSWDRMLTLCTPESRQRFSDAFLIAKHATGDFDLELEIITLRHRRLWVRLIGHLEKVDGMPFRAYGSVQNIQSQKLAQIGMENSANWLKLSMNMAHIHAWRWDRASDTLEFAMIDQQMMHLPRVFPGLKKFVSRVHPTDRLAVRRAIDRAFATGEEVHEEFRLKAHDGVYRCFASIARPLFDASHHPSGLVGVTQDVTDRHEAELRLRRSEEVLRTTTSNSADILLLLDTDLKIRFTNRPMRGLSIEELSGQDVSALMPPSDRAAVLSKLRQVLATGETATYEFEATGSDGVTQYLENRAVLVREEGVATGISITLRNITTRKRLEQEILDVSNRERQTIGRDLHDGLGQELTGVALMLRGLEGSLRKRSPEFVEQVNEIVGLVNQSIETARSLARGLLLVNTDNGGLPFALRSLVERSRNLYGIAVTFKAEVSPELALSETNASHLYRIAQEALTNTARHGHATAAMVFLRVTSTGFLLEISDDGVGTAAGAQSTPGMGLKIMKYRASMIGAKFDILPNQPQGTIIRVTGEQSPATGKLQSGVGI